MAEKGDKKKEASGGAFEKVFSEVVLLFILTMLLFRATSFFSPTGEGLGAANALFESLTGGPNGWFANLVYYAQKVLSIYVTFATIFSIVVFLAIIYTVWATRELAIEEKRKKASVVYEKEAPSMQSQKWQKVQMHANSQNPAEWRLAILEADVLLDDMLQSLGFHGETLGERLKNAPAGDFKSIDSAWEAHKIRNAIAHEGSDFLLSQRESKRILSLYETVFKEFSYV